MDTVKYFFETYDVTVHGNQKIEAVYTNDPAELERVLDMYQKWFAAGDPKIMGLDMEYTSDRALKDKSRHSTRHAPPCTRLPVCQV